MRHLLCLGQHRHHQRQWTRCSALRSGTCSIRCTGSYCFHTSSSEASSPVLLARPRQSMTMTSEASAGTQTRRGGSLFFASTLRPSHGRFVGRRQTPSAALYHRQPVPLIGCHRVFSHARHAGQALLSTTIITAVRSVSHAAHADPTPRLEYDDSESAKGGPSAFNQNGLEEDDDYDYDAYEDLILNAQADGSATVAASPKVAHHLDSEGETQSHSTALASGTTADDVVTQTLQLLPTDGTALKLTDLTLVMNVEAIVDQYDCSVLQFLQRFPAHFQCEQRTEQAPKGVSTRWYIARATPARRTPASATIESPSAAGAVVPTDGSGASQLRLDDMYAEEDRQSLNLIASPLPSPPRRAARTDGQSFTRVSPSPVLKRTRRRLVAVTMESFNGQTAPVTNAAPYQKEADMREPHATNEEERGAGFWKEIASLLPPDAPLALAVVRHEFLRDEHVEHLHRAGMGLGRLLRVQWAASHHHVSLSRDGVWMARVGVLEKGGIETWSPHHRRVDSAELPVSKPSHKESEEDWVVDLGLEEADDDFAGSDQRKSGRHSEEEEEVLANSAAAAVAINGSTVSSASSEQGKTVDDGSGDAEDEGEGGEQDDNEAVVAFTSTAVAPAVYYDGLADGNATSSPVPGAAASKRVSSSATTVIGVKELNWAKIARAPTVPSCDVAKSSSSASSAPPGYPSTSASSAPSTSTAVSDSQKKAPKKRTARLPRSDDELLALHTTLAAQRGWYAPADMLNLFVECVPSFFVPVSALLMSDVLARALGPQNTMEKAIRAYPYYFEREKETDVVRLKPTVQHSGAGAANVHYPQWDPQISEAADADVGDSLHPHRSLHTLRGTAATRSFPVLKSVIRSTVVLPPRPRAREAAHSDASASAVEALSISQRTSCTAVRRESPATTSVLTAASTAPLHLFQVPVNERTPVQALLVHLLRTLPFDRCVPLSAIVAGVCTAEGTPPSSSSALQSQLQGVLQCDDATAHAVFLVRKGSEHSDAENEICVGLRPLWLAPGATDQCDPDSLPPELVRQLRPLWIPLERVLRRLPPGVQDALQERAVAQCRPREASAKQDDKESVSPTETIASYLRSYGACCWVDEKGICVRRFTGEAEMDDITHIAVPFLHAIATHRYEPLRHVLLTRGRALLNAKATALSTAVTKEEQGKTTEDDGIVGMLLHSSDDELQRLIERHPKVLEVTTEANQRELMIRRKTAFASYSSPSL